MDGSTEYHYCFSESGYMNSTLWGQILDRFASIWELHNSRECILLTDNLRFHHDLDPIIKANDKLVHLVFLPPNTSHFLQPLDDLVFARYKVHLAAFARELASALQQQGERMSALEIITAVTAAAEDIAFKVDVVKKSFENCGIWPLNVEKIISLAYVNIGKQDLTVTPQKSKRPIKGQRLSSKEYIKRIQEVVIAKNSKNAELIAAAKRRNTRVTVTTEYETMWDTSSTLKKGEIEAENAGIAIKKKEDKGNESKEKKMLADRKKIERQNLAEAKAVRGLKRNRDGTFDNPAGLELKCIADGCLYWWNTGCNDNWRFCDHCDANGVCESHWDEGPDGAGQRAVADHEERCPRRPKKRPKLD